MDDTEFEAELGGGPLPGKVGLSISGGREDREAEIARQYRKLRRVIKELDASDRFSRWATDRMTGPGHWVQFDGLMRYGRVRRDGRGAAGAPSGNIVFFIGSFGEAEPVVDVMLGGWVGHMLDETARDPSLRMGSRTDHLYDLWDELAEVERDGDFAIPPIWRRLARETSPGDYLTLDTVCRWAYGMMDMHFPQEATTPLKGHAQVLARLSSNGDSRPLLVGTPLMSDLSPAAIRGAVTRSERAGVDDETLATANTSRSGRRIECTRIRGDRTPVPPIAGTVRIRVPSAPFSATLLFRSLSGPAATGRSGGRSPSGGRTGRGGGPRASRARRRPG